MNFKRLAVVIALLSLAPPVHAFDVSLEYVKHGEKMVIVDGQPKFQPYGSGNLEKLDELPAGTDWKLPELVSEKPVYALCKLGDREQLFLMDKEKEKDKFFNRLYFDANANGDLTDDPVTEGNIMDGGDGQFMQTTFNRLDIEIELDGKLFPYSLNSNVYCFFMNGKADLSMEQNWMNLYPSFSVACHYRGEFELDGKKYEVLLGDTNGNGQFDETLSLMTTPDGAIYPQ